MRHTKEPRVSIADMMNEYLTKEELEVFAAISDRQLEIQNDPTLSDKEKKTKGVLLGMLYFQIMGKICPDINEFKQGLQKI